MQVYLSSSGSLSPDQARIHSLLLDDSSLILPRTMATGGLPTKPAQSLHGVFAESSSFDVYSIHDKQGTTVARVLATNNFKPHSKQALRSVPWSSMTGEVLLNSNVVLPGVEWPLRIRERDLLCLVGHYGPVEFRLAVLNAVTHSGVFRHRHVCSVPVLRLPPLAASLASSLARLDLIKPVRGLLSSLRNPLASSMILFEPPVSDLGIESALELLRQPELPQNEDLMSLIANNSRVEAGSVPWRLDILAGLEPDRISSVVGVDHPLLEWRQVLTNIELGDPTRLSRREIAVMFGDFTSRTEESEPEAPLAYRAPCRCPTSVKTRSCLLS